MEAVQVSGINQGEYNPELPASTDVQNINHESKRRQRELLFEEHKKLQRMKSQQDEDEESRVMLNCAVNVFCCVGSIEFSIQQECCFCPK